MNRNAFGDPATASNHDASGPDDTEDSVLDTTPGDVLLPILLTYINEHMGLSEYDKLVGFVERRVKVP